MNERHVEGAQNVNGQNLNDQDVVIGAPDHAPAENRAAETTPENPTGSQGRRATLRSANGHDWEGRFSAIFGQTTAGIAQASLSGRIVLANPRYCEIVGRSAAELYELRIQDITYPDDRAATLTLFNRLLIEGQDFTVEKRYVRPDGRLVWVHNSVSLVRDKAGKPQYAVAFTLDITAQKQAERERERLLDRERVAHEELAEVDRRKDEFLAMLGHELRNPLSGIVGAVQVLELMEGYDSATVEMHGIIRRQSTHMTRLIDDLLDISRIASGKIVLQMASIDLNALVTNAVADHQHQFDANKLSLAIAQPATPIWVRGDITRLQQVVTNLLHNSTKFTDPGGAIKVSVRQQGVHAVVEVRDTGIGIAPGEVQTRFEVFHQGDSNRVRSKGGLGLGLAFSQQILEKHGGTLTGTSEGLGRGSTFSAQLPLDRDPVETMLPLAAAGMPRRKRILIVDDRRDARLTLAVFFEKMGQQVAQASTGAEALTCAGEFLPNNIVCDIQLPDMDGYTVVHAVRSDPRLTNTYMIALTGYGQPSDFDRALAAGFDLHLTKPVSFARLRTVLLGIDAGRS